MKTFLVIEDSFEDAFLIQRAFSTLTSCQAVVCRNLSEARSYLQGAGMYADRNKFPIPNGVICDYKLGEERGVEFVKWIKGTDFRNLPVVILSGDIPGEEVTSAKHLGAAQVLLKPAKYEDLKDMLADLANKLCS